MNLVKPAVLNLQGMRMFVRLVVCAVFAMLVQCAWAQPVNPKPNSSPSEVVEIRNGMIPGHISLSAKGRVQLRSELFVERQLADGTFVPVRSLDLDSMKLTEACHVKLNKCFVLSNKTLRPIPWTGMSCSSQCNNTCDKNAKLSGKFRYVVKTCDGKKQFFGEVFTLSQ